MSILNEKIRAIALVIIKHNNKTLVSPGYDKVKDNHFYRLIGGGIEFGETAIEALNREVKEELDTELINCKLLDISENIFTYNEFKGHEICFVFEADFKNNSFYERNEFQILDSDIDNKAIWAEINEDTISKIKPESAMKFF